MSSGFFLQSPWDSQPQEAVQVDWISPLARSLVLADPGQMDLPSWTKTGTRRTPTKEGLVRGFGATLGAGTTDRIETPIRSGNAQRSYFARVFANGPGSSNFGRIFNVGSSAALPFISFDGSGTSKILFTLGNSGSAQFITLNNVATLPAWFDVLCVWDGSTISNLPLIYINGVSVALNSSTPPTGSISGFGGEALTIGNRTSDSARAWDGYIGPTAIWDRALDAREARELTANPWQLFAPQVIQIPVYAAGGVTGTSATTNAADTSSASGTTTVTGTSGTTNAADISAASGSVGSAVSGTSATTNSDDTGAANGTTTVTGSSATTNAPDTSAASGSAGAVTGTSETTNANDSASASGTSGTQLEDTHDGFWAKQWEKLREREKKKRVEEVQDEIQEIEEQIAEVKAVTPPKQKKTVAAVSARDFYAEQTRIVQQLINERQRLIETEEEEFLLLM